MRNRAAFFNWHAHHIQVIGCTIRNTGEHGVMSLRGKHNRIAGCDIYDTGSMGVYMSGGFRDPHQGFTATVTAKLTTTTSTMWDVPAAAPASSTSLASASAFPTT